MSFRDKETATEMVRSQAQLAPSDTSRDNYIDNMLDKSAGKINDETEYRPYLVAALVMWTSKGEQTLTEASGDAKFRFKDDKMNLRPAIESNLRTQQSIDIGDGIEVPDGWDVQTWLDSLCGCRDDGESVGAGVQYVFGATVI